MSRLIDISPALHEGTAVWPGDVRLRREIALSIASGDHIDLSSITTTVHVGAHTDAPSHYAADGVDIASRSLDLYYGPCEVGRVAVERGQRIRPAHLLGPITSPRVLFYTGTFPDPNDFNNDFASLSPELVDHLADLGVVLVGIDTPSIDPFSSKALESHAAVARRDLAILEGVVLGHVAPGRYTLVALPLPLMGADASPVRAALLPE